MKCIGAQSTTSAIIMDYITDNISHYLERSKAVLHSSTSPPVVRKLADMIPDEHDMADYIFVEFTNACNLLNKFVYTLPVLLATMYIILAIKSVYLWIHTHGLSHLDPIVAVLISLLITYAMNKLTTASRCVVTFYLIASMCDYWCMEESPLNHMTI